MRTRHLGMESVRVSLRSFEVPVPDCDPVAVQVNFVQTVRAMESVLGITYNTDVATALESDLGLDKSHGDIRSENCILDSQPSAN